MPDSQKAQRFRDSQGVFTEQEMEAIDARIRHYADANRSHFDERFDALETSLTRLINSAFPDGADKHHEYHASLIQAAEDRKKFWSGIREKLTLGVIGSVLLFVYTAVVEALKHEVRK